MREIEGRQLDTSHHGHVPSEIGKLAPVNSDSSMAPVLADTLERWRQPTVKGLRPVEMCAMRQLEHLVRRGSRWAFFLLYNPSAIS
jgi:hypothetical protein